MTCLRYCIHFTIFNILVTCVSSLDQTLFRDAIHHFVRENMGWEEMQAHLDINVEYSFLQTDASTLANQLSLILGARLQERIEAVKQFQKVLQDNYDDFSTYSRNPDCCNLHVNTFDSRFKTKIDLNQMCETGINTGIGIKSSAVMQKARDLLASIPTLKWIYFGSEEGAMTVYPALDNCAHFDPRYRPWYVEVASPKSKDIVVILDRSGSMAKQHGKDTRLDLVKQAAITVVNGLNPRDRVNVIAFSTDIKLPQESTTRQDCYSQGLITATPRNKKFLQSYIESITPDGYTFYAPALRKAFEFFKNEIQEDSDKRDRVILFLSDGEPQDELEAKRVLKQENEVLGNRAVILTYGMGQDFGEGAKGRQILTDLAEQTGYDSTKGEVVAGTFTHVTGDQELRLTMGSYYNFFSAQSIQDDAIFSVPYLDQLGLGLISSVCLPVHHHSKFRGVTCIDLTVSDLLNDATFFQSGEMSYAFISDGRGQSLIHPLLPRPYQTLSDPSYITIDQLERCSGIETVLSGMKRGERGTARLTCPRIIARGDGLREGVDAPNIDSFYSWAPLLRTNFSLCVVLAVNDHQTQFLPPKSYPSEFYYHNMKLQKGYARTCSLVNRVAFKEGVFTFAPKVFKDPSLYLEKVETEKDMDEYRAFMTGHGSHVNSVFKERIRESVAALSKAGDIWKSKPDSEYTVWRHVGLNNGVYYFYPGVTVQKNYDHTQRPWYRRAYGQKDLMSLSVPYTDAFTGDSIITMCKSIYEGKKSREHKAGDATLGIMCMDFTLIHFYDVLLEIYPECHYSRCFVMDNTGHLVLHEDFVQNTDAKHVNYIHITIKESSVAIDLINRNLLQKETCIDVYKIREQIFWRVKLLIGKVETDHYSLYAIEGTNVFVGIIHNHGGSAFCTCSKRNSQPTSKCLSKICTCPCYNPETRYNPCNDTFLIGMSENLELLCTPEVPPLILDQDLLNEEKHEVKHMDPCFEFHCAERINEKSCLEAFTCTWCKYTHKQIALAQPYCTEIKNCPPDFEKEGQYGGLPTWAAGVIGVVAVLIVLLAIILFFVRKKNCCRRNERSSPQVADLSYLAPIENLPPHHPQPQAFGHASPIYGHYEAI